MMGAWNDEGKARGQTARRVNPGLAPAPAAVGSHPLGWRGSNSCCATEAGMDEVGEPAEGSGGTARPPLRRVARRDEPWTRERPQVAGGHLWNWWDKVRAEIEARGFTVKQLAEAAEIPYRSLHRWLYEMQDEEMRERGPQGELSIIARLSYALGWTWWYTAGAAWQWPPSAGTKRFMEAWERLIEKRRLDVMDPVARAMAACCTMAVDAVEANETTRAAMQQEILRRLGETEPEQ